MMEFLKQKNMKIRLATEKDFNEIWRIFQSVIAGGDTYVNDENTTKDEACAKWMSKSAKTFVAEINDKIVGAYLLRSNQVGRGSHVANASYIVDANTRGAGVGKALALHSISSAKAAGYRAMQFNFVASTNVGAVRLWSKLGFHTVGRLPGAFNHPSKGYVDALVMFKWLASE